MNCTNCNIELTDLNTVIFGQGRHSVCSTCVTNELVTECSDCSTLICLSNNVEGSENESKESTNGYLCFHCGVISSDYDCYSFPLLGV